MACPPDEKQINEFLCPFSFVNIPSDPEAQLQWLFSILPIDGPTKQSMLDRLSASVSEGKKFKRRKVMVQTDKGPAPRELVWELDDDGHEKPLPYEIEILYELDENWDKK